MSLSLGGGLPSFKKTLFRVVKGTRSSFLKAD
jgi:hypothetical protein